MTDLGEHYLGSLISLTDQNHLKSNALLTLTERPLFTVTAVTQRKEMGSLVLARSFCCVGGHDQQGNSLHLPGSVSQRTGQL